MRVSTFTKRFFSCIVCGKSDFTVEHLFESKLPTAGPWYCHECGAGHNIEVVGENTLEVTRSEQDRHSVFSLLELDMEEIESIHFVVRDFDWTRDKPNPGHYQIKGRDYYFEEQSCPSNHFQEVEEVLCVYKDGVGDTDPHGILRYVSSAPIYRDDKEPFDQMGSTGIMHRFEHFGAAQNVDSERRYRWWVVVEGGKQAWPFHDTELALECFRKVHGQDETATLCRVIEGGIKVPLKR